jgi:hypothetical protein
MGSPAAAAARGTTRAQWRRQSRCVLLLERSDLSLIDTEEANGPKETHVMNSGNVCT